MEYQLAQAFFNEIMQFPSVPDSFKALNLTSGNEFSAVFSSESGTSDQRVFTPEVDIQPIRNLENDHKVAAQASNQQSTH